MKRYLFLLLLFPPLILFAGTSTIRVNMEGWGTIIKNSGGTNSRGAMYWNGSEWVTNETAAHTYFTYIETGQRVKTPVNIDISARTSTSSVFDTLGYHILRQNYTYTDLAKQGGSYRYEAVQYRIEPSAGRKVVLRSRGTGNGKEKGYFNIYMEDTLNYITALRNDPLWFTYKGMSMDSALQQSSAIQYLTGSFSSTNGYYFMDINGGADMGGLSYIFHTDTLTASPKTDVLGTSYPIDFGLRCFDTGGVNIVEFRFLPKLVSETYIPQVSPAVVTTDSISNISKYFAVAWGNVSNDGGNAVTERGMVFSTMANPTVETGTKITSGNSKGVFSAIISELTGNTTYHVRAYAVNSQGISYGGDKSFTTTNTAIANNKTEGTGVINKKTGETNPNGSMVWNGNGWVVNGTYHHQYFVDIRNGKRLHEIKIISIKDISAAEFDTLGYHILRRNYSYTTPAKDRGMYSFVATENVLTNKSTGKQIVLRTRGTGNGFGSAYFDIYFEDDITTGNPQTITAFRNDPKWFTYSGMTIAQALAQTDTLQYLTGNLPTAGGWYFLDFGGGGDLGPAGVGKSYILHTDSLPLVSKTSGIVSSFPINFAIRYMDSSGWNVYELDFLPKLISETYISNTGIGDFTKNKSNGIKVYPNPFKEGINVTGVKTRTMLNLRDLTGRLLFNREIQEDITIRTSSLPAGMYILKIVTGDGSLDKKLIKK